MSGEGVHNPSDPTQILANIATLQADVDDIQDDVTDIMAVTDGLPTLTEMVGSTTTTVINTEYNLYVNNAPLGVYRPICCKVWFLYQTAAETVILRVYYRIADGAVMALQDGVTYVGVQDPVLINIDLEPTRYGVLVTVERTAGSARAYPWEACYEI